MSELLDAAIIAHGSVDQWITGNTIHVDGGSIL
jgi:hypothetical protein